MKQVLALEDMKNIEAMDLSECIELLGQIKQMESELSARKKTVQKKVISELKALPEMKYADNKNFAEIQTINRKSIDINWVKNFVEEQNCEPRMKETTVEKLNIKRLF